MQSKMSKKVHFIGVAGSAIAPLAIMMRNSGWEVTGSDEGVFEPALSLLNNAGVKWFEGYDPSRVDDIDLVIVGGAPLMKDAENIEYVHAKSINKRIEGYAYLLQEYVVRETSIVVAGSYGKTTTTSLINWILETAGKNPSFMIGGKPINFETGVRATNSKISCLEGDEFVSVFNLDHEPRFIYYKPQHTLISAAKWDHVNVYPQEELYVNAYKKLIDKTIQNKGHLYIAINGENNDILIDYAKEKGLSLTTYAINDDKGSADLTAQITSISDVTTSFDVYKNSELLGSFRSNLIGRHNVENCLAAISVTNSLDIDLSKIQKGISTFLGIERRLQIIGHNSQGSVIIDDFAHSAMKAEASIDALKSTFKDKKLVVVYNPRLSAREDRRELDFYKGAFDKADKVIIPRIIVKRSTPKENRIYGADIVKAINQTKETAEYIPKNENIINYLRSVSDPNTIIAFMSASGWGDLMKQTIQI